MGKIIILELKHILYLTEMFLKTIKIKDKLSKNIIKYKI
jgi:hypothetical protein